MSGMNIEAVHGSVLNNVRNATIGSSRLVGWNVLIVTASTHTVRAACTRTIAQSDAVLASK